MKHKQENGVKSRIETKSITRRRNNVFLITKLNIFEWRLFSSEITALILIS